MSAMLKAIQNKRKGMLGDHQMGHTAEHAEEKGKDLHGFVQSLSDDEKHSLKQILHSDGGHDATQEIAKGGPSTEEKTKIDAASTEEDEHNALEVGEEQHDDIGKSMLDSKFSSGKSEGMKPRNLGERMKMGIASKLKAKGKL